jgi:hypothetical protein
VQLKNHFSSTEKKQGFFGMPMSITAFMESQKKVEEYIEKLVQ